MKKLLLPLLLLLTACDQINYREAVQPLVTNESGTVTWTNADDWTDVYAKIQTAMSDAGGGPVVVLVEPNAAQYEMTPAGAYELSRVKFQGMNSFMASSIAIADGVTWDPDTAFGMVTVSSDGIAWSPSCATTPLVTGGSVLLSISNGGLFEHANDARVFQSLDGLYFNLQHAMLAGTEGAANGMISVSGAFGSIFTGSFIRAGTFADASGVGVTADSSSAVDPAAGVTGSAFVGYPHFP